MPPINSNPDSSGQRTSSPVTFSGYGVADFLIGVILWFLGARIITLCWSLPKYTDAAVAGVAGIVFVFLHAHLAGSAQFDVTGKRRERTGLRDVIHFEAITGNVLLVAAAMIGFLLLQLGVAVLFLNSLGHSAASSARLAPSAHRGWLQHAVFIIVGAVFEEFSLRGWIQGSVEQRMGIAPAVIVSATVFALGHVVPFGGPLGFAPGVFILGVLCGVAVYLTGSIWAAVLLHAAANSSVVILSAATARGYQHRLSPGVGTTLIVAALIVTGLSVLIGAGVKLWRTKHAGAEV